MLTSKEMLEAAEKELIQATQMSNKLREFEAEDADVSIDKVEYLLKHMTALVAVSAGWVALSAGVTMERLSEDS